MPTSHGCCVGEAEKAGRERAHHQVEEVKRIKGEILWLTIWFQTSCGRAAASCIAKGHYLEGSVNGRGWSCPTAQEGGQHSLHPPRGPLIFSSHCWDETQPSVSLFEVEVGGGEVEINFHRKIFNMLNLEGKLIKI